MPGDIDRDNTKHRTRNRAARKHQGSAHWHVERRSNVIICGTCGARIPKNAKPSFCPECGAGKR